MKVLAFDQSTRVTGWAFGEDGKLIKHGIISVDSGEKNPITRILSMHDLAANLVDELKPDYCVIEDTQYQNSMSVFQLLAYVCGTFITLFHQRNLPFTIVPPNTWKSVFGVQGRKRAEQKASTQKLVKERYGLDVTEDEADAIGILYWSKNSLERK